MGTVGKNEIRIDALTKADGSAKYLQDFSLPEMLYAKVLRSSISHGEIISIDTSEAETMPGVVCVLTGNDVPNHKYSFFPRLADRYVLAKDKVRFIGEEVAAVAASNYQKADEAVGNIRVEYKPLSTVFDLEKAIVEDSEQVHDQLIGSGNIAKKSLVSFGDLEGIFSAAEYVFEDDFYLSSHSHCCMETHGCLAVPDGNGEVTVWATTQCSHLLRDEISIATGIASEKIRVKVSYVGGGFGSKTAMDASYPICVLLALKTRKPVKLALTREEEFIASGTRYAMKIRLATAVKKNRIVGRKTRILIDNGAYNNKGPAIASVAARTSLNLYKPEAAMCEWKLVYTNSQFGTAFRGFGNPQMTFAIEVQMDQIAEKLSIDPAELRLINANKEGDVSVAGQRIGSCGLRECLSKALEVSKYRYRRNSFRENKGRYRRGIGLALAMHTGGGGKGYQNANFSGAFVKVNDDGCVDIMTGACEIGQGTTTVLAQIGAEVLGIPLTEVRIHAGDTNIVPMDLGAFASRQTFIAGNAVFNAATAIRNQLMEIAAKELNALVSDIVWENGSAICSKTDKMLRYKELVKKSYFDYGRPLIASAIYDDPISSLPDSKGYGNTNPCTAFAVQVAEVEVDTHTGLVKVNRVVAAHDVGKAINPLLVEGQIRGGIAQGIGMALWETSKHTDASGSVTPIKNFVDYKIVGSGDMPVVTPIIVESIEPSGPFGAKGIGEIVCVPTSAAIINAVYDAVGIKIRSLPINREELYFELKKKAAVVRA